MKDFGFFSFRVLSGQYVMFKRSSVVPQRKLIIVNLGTTFSISQGFLPKGRSTRSKERRELIRVRTIKGVRVAGLDRIF